MTGDKVLYAGISCSLFDDTACGVWVESIRLDVVAAADVSEEGIAGNAGAFLILI